MHCCFCRPTPVCAARAGQHEHSVKPHLLEMKRHVNNKHLKKVLDDTNGYDATFFTLGLVHYAIWVKLALILRHDIIIQFLSFGIEVVLNEFQVCIRSEFGAIPSVNCVPRVHLVLSHPSSDASKADVVLTWPRYAAVFDPISYSLSLQVPEIISTLRQAGKSSARSDVIAPVSVKTTSGGHDPPEACHSSVSAKATSTAASAVISPTAFAKKFEVLFCGRASVAHKKAPPALIDECIEKFGQLHGSGASEEGATARGSAGAPQRASFQPNGLGGADVRNGAAGSPTAGKRPALFKGDPSFPCLQALDENGLSPEISHTNTTEAHSAGVQPTSLQENRTMLFMVSFMKEHAR